VGAKTNFGGIAIASFSVFNDININLKNRLYLLKFAGFLILFLLHILLGS